MSEFKENVKKAERLLKIAKNRQEYADCNDLYDFLGIDKTATKEQIKTSIGENYKFYLPRQNLSDWEPLTQAFISARRAVEYLLCECRLKYDNHLVNLKVKKLRKHFIVCTRADDCRLGTEEKQDVLKKGTEIGLPKTQVIKILNQWMNKKGARPSLKASAPDEDDIPILKVICKMDGYYVYKDVKKGTPLIETIVIKNEHKGQLKGRIISDVEWLMPETECLASQQEQILAIHILSAKIPVNTYDAQGTITINSNGGPPYSVFFRVILEDLKIAVDRFRKTYVPLVAVCAGFIGSLSASSFPYFLAGAVVVGLISYFIAEFIVKALLKNGLNLFKFPAVFIQAAAGSIVILTLLPDSVIKQEAEQEKPDIPVQSVNPPVTVAPQPEQLQARTEAEKVPAIEAQVDHNRQSSLADDIVANGTVELSGRLIGVDSDTAGSNALWEFGFEAAEDKTHYGFGCGNHDELHFLIGGNEVDRAIGTEAMKMYPNRVILHVRSPDWEVVQKCSTGAHCDESVCPLAVVIEPKTDAEQPPIIADVLTRSVEAKPSRALRKNTRIASSAVKKQWTPKTSSFAPPSRDDL